MSIGIKTLGGLLLPRQLECRSWINHYRGPRPLKPRWPAIR